MPPDETTVGLREKSSTDRRTWLVGHQDEYRKELLDAGNSPEETEENIERNRSQVFLGDDLADGHYVFDVVRDDKKIGSLWLGARNEAGSEWWIYDIVIDESFRGTGLGRAALLAAEAFVKARGGTRLGLNVFGSNAVARHLYEAADYQVKSLQMYKVFC